MKQGKIAENVLKRSILKKMGYKRSEVLLDAGVGEDCACLHIKGDVLCTSNPVTGDVNDAYKAINNIAATGGEAIGILSTILLPETAEEADIKEIQSSFDNFAKKEKLQILGGHTEISDAVNKPVVNITAVGRTENLIKSSAAKPGDDVVLTKWIGLEGTYKIAKAKEDELLKKFPDKYIYDAKNFDKYLSVVPEAATAVKSGVSAMHDVTRGGVFAGLWEIAESSGVGLLIDLRKIPVKQETIEICNFFDINPYELASAGALLITSSDGNKLVLELEKEGIAAAVIGKCTDSNDKVLINGENKRFLEPPKSDEIYKVL